MYPATIYDCNQRLKNIHMQIKIVKNVRVRVVSTNVRTHSMPILPRTGFRPWKSANCFPVLGGGRAELFDK